jgi:signal transduction histidine kinase/CheY-like chemotaxis protein
MPIIIFMIFRAEGHSILNIGQQALASPAFEIIAILNFLTLGLAHYLFQQSFQQNLHEKSILNQELIQAVAEANRSAQSKSDFLSTMSHELRTPLNSVIGMTELLMDDPHTEEQEENLKILNFSAVSLHSLINDILDYNKIDSGKLHLEATRVNLYELIESICAGLRLQAIEKGLDLILEADEAIVGQYVTTDPVRISQIMFNLVGNGIKFTRQGGVKVSLKVLQNGQDELRIRFSIKDTGIGISVEKHEVIFEPFIQASGNTTRKFGGTGLGLAIVKRLLTMFNSTIYLKSKAENGSEFYFDISFSRAAMPMAEKKSSKEIKYDLTGLKVLVAEDNPVNVLLLKKLLTKWNIEPVFAENGIVAIEKLTKGKFDVILMDIHMPFMDGYEATNEIRSLTDPVKSSISIIALTASVSNLEQRIKEVGMNDYIYKPFNSKELYSKLERISRN